ncbi:MAG: DUF6889 family protein [Paludibacteraceae bacterium]
MEYYQFFRRKPLDFAVRSNVEFVPAQCKNLNEFQYAPVIAGVWQQHQLWDKTYTLDDLLDIHEIMTVKHENEYRASEAAKNNRGGGA